MSVLVYSSSPEKNGQPVAVTLIKSDILQISEVSSSPYWSQAENIKNVEINFTSDDGRQKKILKFKFSDATPSSTVSFSPKAKNLFKVRSVVLTGEDQGMLRIGRLTSSASTQALLDSLEIDLS